MSSETLLYLSRSDVEAAAPDMPAILALVEAAYREKGRGRVEAPPKLGIHPTATAFIHAMPAYIEALEAAGVKWVAAYPENVARGLPNISGLIVLSQPETGLPQAVLDCTWITAMRTGAKSAIAAKYLANPDSRTVGIIACGAQGRSNLLALASVFRLRRVLAYDIDPSARQRFIDEMQFRLDPDSTGDERVEFLPMGDLRLLLAESDIVVTSGPIIKRPQPQIEAGWLPPGAFASAVDYASYWTPAAIAEMDHFVTDDRAQFADHRRGGYFDGVPDPNIELADLLSGKHPGRQAPGERGLAMCLGSALDDMALAPEVVRRARRLGLGIELPR